MSFTQQLSGHRHRAGGGEIESRREQNMRLKRERIFRVVSDLLRARGFSAVTTQEVSAAAGVGAGTLFRYAATGSELMLMVYNEALRSSMAEGAARAAEKSAAYQRELLFGPHDAKFRAEGMELIFALEASLSDTLRRAAPHLSDDEAQAAASSLVAVAHPAIARLTASEPPCYRDRRPQTSGHTDRDRRAAPQPGDGEEGQTLAA